MAAVDSLRGSSSVPFSPAECDRLKRWAELTPDDIYAGIKRSLETPEAQENYRRVLEPIMESIGAHIEAAMVDALGQQDDAKEIVRRIVLDLEPRFRQYEERLARLEAALFRSGP